MIAFLMGADILNYNLSQGAVKANHSAHFGGWWSGLAMGIVIGKNFEKKKREYVIQFLMLVAYGSICTFCVIWASSHFPPKPFWTHGAVDDQGYCWMRLVSSWTYFGDSEWHCVQCESTRCIDDWTAVVEAEPMGVYMVKTTFTKCIEKYGGVYDDPNIPK